MRGTELSSSRDCCVPPFGSASLPSCSGTSNTPAVQGHLCTHPGWRGQGAVTDPLPTLTLPCNSVTWSAPSRPDTASSTICSKTVLPFGEKWKKKKETWHHRVSLWWRYVCCALTCDHSPSCASHISLHCGRCGPGETLQASSWPQRGFLSSARLQVALSLSRSFKNHLPFRHPNASTDTALTSKGGLSWGPQGFKPPSAGS